MTSPVDVFLAAVEDGAFPGGQLAASREGQLLARVAAGRLGPELAATNEEVLYDLASLTKPLSTALLTMRAMEDGLLTLEDPLARWVVGVDPRITVAHALEHATGLPAHARFDRTLPQEVLPGTWEAYRHVVEAAARVPCEAVPGTRALYSDLGFILLGAALEAVWAEPLSSLHARLSSWLAFRDRRGPPAPGPAPTRAPIAPTEGCPPGEVHDENARAMGGAAGHAGLFGTALEVLALAEALLTAYHGARGGLLLPETVRRMFAPSRVQGSTRTLGWDRPSPEGSSTGGRWPPHSVGHLGFTGTSLWIEPERALAVVLVTNRVCPTRDNERIRKVRPALHDAAFRAWAR